MTVFSALSASPSRSLRYTPLTPDAEIQEKIGNARHSRNHPLLYPRFDCFPQFAQASLEEMVGAFDQHELLRLGDGRNQRFQLGSGAELISRSADNTFRFGTIPHEVKRVHARFFGVGGDWNHRSSNADDRNNSRVGIRSAQSDGSAEGESGKHNWQMILGIEPVERGADIVHFADAVVAFALAQA